MLERDDVIPLSHIKGERLLKREAADVDGGQCDGTVVHKHLHRAIYPGYIGRPVNAHDPDRTINREADTAIGVVGVLPLQKSVQKR
jgi:hypothetical protein